MRQKMPRLKLVLSLLSFSSLLAVVTPVAAHEWNWTNPPSFYNQGPGGAYEDHSDFTRAVQGTPCDYECTLRAQRRWGVQPPHPFRSYFYPNSY